MSPTRLISLLLVLFTLLLFSRVREFEFINFDDPAYVTGNPHVQRGLTADGLSWAFAHLHGEATYWHPLTWISHMIDVELFGAEAGAHHIMNVLWHALNVLLLFHVLRRYTGSVWRSATVAALFAFHPLQVDTVAWVAERKNVLSGLFWLLTMLAYLRYTEAPSRGRFALVALSMALGLMSKPVLVTLPCVLLLLDLWPLRRVTLKGSAVRKRQGTVTSIPLRRAVLEKLPLFALSLVSSIITLAGHARLGTTLSTEELPIHARLANAIVSYGRYLSKSFWPRNLSVYYPLETWAAWQVVLALFVIGGISVMAILLWRRGQSYVAVGWLWFVGVLVPTIGLVQASTQAMADRFAYLPLIGLFLALVWSAAAVLATFRAGKTATSVFAVAVLVTLGTATWRQLGHWRNSATLFTHALAVTKDNAVAHNNLGTALESARKFGEAEKHYREAIRLKPQSPQAYNNLGNVLDEIGRSEEALAAYQHALRLRTNVALVHNNLGVVLAKLGRLEEAETNFARAMELQPRDAHAYYLMGTLQLRRAAPRSAVTAFQTALDLNPNHLRALSLFSRLLAASDDPSLRDPARAVELAERAAALTPKLQPVTLDTLAIAYAAAGRFDDAVRAEDEAAELFKSAPENASISVQIQQRRSLFQARTPFRENATNLVAQRLRD